MTIEDSSHSTHRMGLIMLVIAWVALMAALIAYFTQSEESALNPNQAPESVSDNGRTTVVLKANRQQHYVANGQINGADVVFMLDTGATRVAIPFDMADRLGLTPGRKGISHTANGRVTTYSTVIKTLQIGEITLYDVPADLSASMNDHNAILLGMSALSQVEFTQRDGLLLLTQ